MRKSVAVLAVGVVAFACADTASAIPAFARRYGVECHMCHQGFPKLSRTGERFKQRGFRLENEDPFKVEDFIKSVPIAVRASGSSYFFEDEDSFESAFVKAITAGSLGSRVSYWVDYGFLFDNDDTNDTSQDPDNAWARVELLKSGKLYARGGRIELDLPFTQTRTPNLFSYEIYNGNTGVEIDNLSSYREGVEFGGSLKEDKLHWSVAIVGGVEDTAGEALYADNGLDDPTDDFEGNVYLRLAHRGEAHRFGGFAYFGRNTLASGAPSAPQTWSDDLVRVGVDADLQFSKLNVYGMFAYGHNSDSLPSPTHVGGLGQSADFHGGFVQADYMAFEKDMSGFLKSISFALTLRGNYVKEPPSGVTDSESSTSIYPGARLWVRERLRLAFEYGFKNKDRPSDGAVLAELVF